VTAVEPDWLAELGPLFFSIKETHSSRMEQRQKEKVWLVPGIRGCWVQHAAAAAAAAAAVCTAALPPK
jgi:hypothetical protein